VACFYYRKPDGYRRLGDPYPQWPADVQATYAYDPTLAKQMLATAGFPSGFNTDLVLESDADQGLYQIVQSELASVGINMSIFIEGSCQLAGLCDDRSP